jgi:hypothetical protein
MPEDDKVRRLLMGIQTATLQTAVLFVRSSPALRGNFDAAVDSITTVVETIKDTSKRPFSQVSSATTEDEDPADAASSGRGYQGHPSGGRGGRGYQSRGGRGRGRGRGSGGRGRGEPWTEPITTRWYQGHELARMTDDQRHQMRGMREGRQIGATETSSRNSGQPGTADPVGHASGHGQYYPPPGLPPPYHHLPPYLGTHMMLPPPPPPPTHNINAIRQHAPYLGNRGHPGVSRFDGNNSQGFAQGPARF